MKQAIQQAIQAFAQGDYKTNALNFFKVIGYESNKSSDADLTMLPNLNHDKALVEQWQFSGFLFQLDDSDLQDNLDIFSSSNQAIDNTIIESYIFVAIELKHATYNRSTLVQITRELNKVSLQPILILFKYDNSLTLSVIHRRLNKKDSDKDVLEKVTLLKDIRIENPHRAHLEILNDLAFEHLKPKPANFVELHKAWQKVLDTKELNKQFYNKLFDWYLFALSQVKFPQIRPESDLIENEQHQSESLIRLLTRLLFVWFMKEKGLINEDLFNETELKSILKNFVGKDGEDTLYYKAILQNLFFATLNMPIDKRKVIDKGFNPKEYGDQLVYRYADCFNDADFIKYFANIPFLNGGLFDCLDQKKDDNNPIEIRLDGFSSVKSKQAIVPDKLFFGEYKAIDLSDAYGDKKKNKITVYGLIEILQQYKFTVEENTPIEEDIALDPELLGKVFENLLAAYNPETGVTARKQTGSFYTPREIVDYMVDESLCAYFESVVSADLSAQARINSRLRQLLSYQNLNNPFNETETTDLIKAIDDLKILDPACGSGAFPMGILHKLVFVLSKLDPDNRQWRALQKQKAMAETEAAFNLGNYQERETRLKEINDAFDFNASDYGRKLFLIENCLHGVDIQPIAVQISKLRFFISLIVEQQSDKEKPNLGIRALPNLDFKLIAANTLIAAPCDEFEGQAIFEDSFFAEFSALTHDYFKVAQPQEKRALRRKIEKLIHGKCEEKIKAVARLSAIGKAKDKKIIEHQEQDVKLWQSYDNLFKHEAVAFFEPKYFFPQINNGFDIVIGNPPYIQIQKFSGQACQKDWQAQNYQTFEKTGDIYALFIEKGVSLLKPNGLLTFITSNKWMRAGYGKSLREFLATKTSPLKLIDFGGFQVFESATVDSNILILENRSSIALAIANETKTAKAVLLREDNKAFQACTIQKDFTIDTNLADYFAAHQQSISLNSSEVWVIYSNIEQQIKTKIEAKGTPLKEWDVSINYGIKTGFNEAFIIDTETKERLCSEDAKSAEIIKPILRGRDIKRYSAEWAGLWIIGTFPALHLNIDNYPAVKNYLESFGKRLHQTGENGCRKKTGNQWFETQDQIGYWQEFEKGKIVYPNMTKYRPFLFDTDKYFSNDKSFIMTSNTVNLKFITAILNSWVFDFAFKDRFPELIGGTRELRKIFFELLPIPTPPPEQQQPFIDLVDKILAAKKQNQNTDLLEQQIDNMVYQLYGLTDDEIKIIEGVK